LTTAIAVHVCDPGSQRSILEVLESETHVGRRTVHWLEHQATQFTVRSTLY